MVTQDECRLAIMKRGIRKVHRKDKMMDTTSASTASTNNSTVAATKLTAYRKPSASRTHVGSGTVRSRRPPPERRRLTRCSQSDSRVRDYLLSLPEQIEPESNTTGSRPEVSPVQRKPNTTCTGNVRSTPVKLNDLYRGRRKSLTYTDAHFSRIPPLQRDRSVLNFAYKPLPIKTNDQSYDPFKEPSGHLDIIERIRDKSIDGQLPDDDTEVTETRERDNQFIRDINNVQERLNSVNVEPFFSKWKIAGFKHNQVLIASTTNMDSEPEKKTVSPEFVQYIKERDAARAEVKTALEELRDTQCRLYDAIQEIERLEKKAKVSTTKKTNPPKKKVPAQTQNLKVPSATSGSSSGVSSARTSTVNSVRTGIDGVYHPPIESIEPDVDTCEYYWKIGEMFPTLPMFYILDAEKKFIKADLDYSGSIDKDELGKVLEDGNELLFTPSQVEVIFKEVDTNSSDYVDFYEVLVVLNKLYSRRKTNLPLSLQQNYSRTCNMQ